MLNKDKQYTGFEKMQVMNQLQNLYHMVTRANQNWKFKKVAKTKNVEF